MGVSGTAKSDLGTGSQMFGWMRKSGVRSRSTLASEVSVDHRDGFVQPKVRHALGLYKRIIGLEFALLPSPLF